MLTVVFWAMKQSSFVAVANVSEENTAFIFWVKVKMEVTCSSEKLVTTYKTI
jgi:hypothetical protein